MNKIMQINTVAGTTYKVGEANGGAVIAGIQYKRDGNMAYKGQEGCYEIFVVLVADLEKKEEKKKEVPVKHLYTVPGHSVTLVTHDIADDNKGKKGKKEDEPVIVLERVE